MMTPISGPFAESHDPTGTILPSPAWHSPFGKLDPRKCGVPDDSVALTDLALVGSRELKSAIRG